MDIKRNIIIISIILVVIAGVFISFGTWIPATLSSIRTLSPALFAVDNATGGIVVDKEVREKLPSPYHDGGTFYYLYVDVPYLENGETKHTTKKFTVSDITYRLYSEGDYFDIEKAPNDETISAQTS